MAYEPSYFEDEVREGFFIPGMIKRSWAVQMDILNQVKRICEKYNISWFADYGTLIGAVRHNGFIPWDDDLDISMLRSDYDRFLAVAKEELPEDYRVLNIYTEDEYENFLTRIVNHSEINTNASFLADNNEFPYIAGIDILPLDYIYSDENKEKERWLRAKGLLTLAESVKGAKGVDKNAVIRQAEEFCKFKIDRTLPLDIALVHAITGVFNECSGEGSTEVALMPSWIRHKSGKAKIKWLQSIVSMPFENTTINVPCGYSEKLRNSYGTWYIAKRSGGAHEYPFFGEQEKTLKEYRNGILPYCYRGQKEDLVVPGSSPLQKTDEIGNIYAVLFKANELVCKLVETGECKPIPELLEQCQQLAIQIGSSIENQNPDFTEPVIYLERFCEAVFGVYTEIFEGGSCGNENTDKMNDCLSQSYRAYLSMPIKKKALFIPYKAEYWKRMDSFYEELISDGEWTAEVMPVPYFYRTFDGKLKDTSTGGIIDAASDYPDKLTIVDYRSFDANSSYYDMIVFQNPFDEWNSSVSIHPVFFSSNLRKLTNNLVYIPYFVTGDIYKNDEKAYKNLSYYAISKGVFLADEVILDSEITRQAYIDVLSERMGANTENIWESKIKVKIDQTKTTVNTGKKKLLVYIGTSELFTDGEMLITKLSECLEEFERSKQNVSVLWCGDSTVLDNLRSIDARLADRFERLIQRFEISGTGEYHVDVTEKSVMDCDAFYGTPGYIMNLCVQNNIPVMLVNAKVTGKK